MPKFIPFDRHAPPPTGSPFVTIQRDGNLITINRAAYQLLQSPQSVELSYDPDEKLIGIRAIKSTDPRSYPVRTQGGHTFEIAGRAFTQYWSIDTSVARRYKVYMEGVYLIVDLKSEGIDVTGVRSKFRNLTGQSTKKSEQ
jgi:hypothetical protein